MKVLSPVSETWVLENIRPTHVYTKISGDALFIWRDEDVWQSDQADKNFLVYRDNHWQGCHLPYEARNRDACKVDKGCLWINGYEKVIFFDVLDNEFVETNSVYNYGKIIRADGNTAWLLRDHEPVVDECVAHGGEISRMSSIRINVNDLKSIVYSPAQKRYFGLCKNNTLYSISIDGVATPVPFPHGCHIELAEPFLLAIDHTRKIIYCTDTPEMGWNEFDCTAIDAGKIGQDKYIQYFDTIVIEGRLFAFLHFGNSRWHKSCAVFSFDKNGPRVLEAFNYTAQPPEVHNFGYFLVLSGLAETTPVLSQNCVLKGKDTIFYDTHADIFKDCSSQEIPSLLRAFAEKIETKEPQNRIRTPKKGAKLTSATVPITLNENIADARATRSTFSSNAVFYYMFSGVSQRLGILPASSQRVFVLESPRLTGFYNLCCDEQGNLWGTSGHGIFRISHKLDYIQFHFFKYTAHLLAAQSDRILLWDDKTGEIIERSYDGCNLEQEIRYGQIYCTDVPSAKYSEETDEWLVLYREPDQNIIIEAFSARAKRAVLLKTIPTDVHINLLKVADNRYEFVMYHHDSSLVSFSSDPRKTPNAYEISKRWELGRFTSYAIVNEQRYATYFFSGKTYLLNLSHTSDVPIAVFNGNIELAPIMNGLLLFGDMQSSVKPSKGSDAVAKWNASKNAKHVFYLPGNNTFYDAPPPSLAVFRGIASHHRGIRLPGAWSDKRNTQNTGNQSIK